MINVTELVTTTNNMINLIFNGLSDKLSDEYKLQNNLQMLIEDKQLANLLYELSFKDDLTITLANGQSYTIRRREKMVAEHQIKPYAHQLEGILFGLNDADSWLLLDEPGMGKTLQILYLAEELHIQRQVEHCLIICGVNALKANWEKEIKRYSNLTGRILGKKVTKSGKISYGSVKSRIAELNNPIADFFVIVNIESLRNDDFIKALKRSPNKFDVVVLDEAHLVANKSSAQGHNFLKLKDHRYRIALTGTLILNNPINAYNILSWIGVDKSTLTNFKANYCVKGGFGDKQIVGYKNLDLLKDEISSSSLRRKKSEILGQPQKFIIDKYIDMTDSQRAFYDDLKAGIKRDNINIEINKDNILALYTRLRQATTFPMMLTDEHIESAKISYALDLVDQICASGNKVVIISMFKQPLRYLFDKLTERGYQPLLNTGDIPDPIISDNIDQFQTNPDKKIFLGTVAKCGTGITLNAASYMIFLDQSYVNAINEQVQDRIFRITNTESVCIYNLICADSIDEHVAELVAAKKDLSDYIVDDATNERLLERLRAYIMA